MVWLLFLASSAGVVLAAIKLAEYSDIIAVRTRLGGLVVGAIFLLDALAIVLVYFAGLFLLYQRGIGM